MKSNTKGSLEDVGVYVRGMSESAAELQELLAQAASHLRALDRPGVDQSIERRVEIRRELAGVLLDAFEKSVSFRTTFEILERATAEKL